jgi:D-3-phosphoglycerate dehydrogenase
MSQHHVLLTDYVTRPAVKEEAVLAAPDFAVDYLHLAPSPDEAKAMMARADAVIVWHHPIDDAFLAQTPRLKVVVRYGVGFDNVDVAAVHRRGLVFCNNPDYGVDEVSDTAVGFVLLANRRMLSYFAQVQTPSDAWQERVFDDVRRLSKFRVGIVGAGRIGGAVALKLRALGADVTIFDPYQPAGIEKMLGVKRVRSLLELAAQSDALTLHCPLTSETRGFIDAKVLAALPKGATLINTARGPVVGCVDEAFVAVEQGRLYGLYLDVLPEEPPKPDSVVAEYLRGRRYGNLKDRILINPHIAYHSRDAADEMRHNAASIARDFLEHGITRNRILPEHQR